MPMHIHKTMDGGDIQDDNATNFPKGSQLWPLAFHLFMLAKVFARNVACPPRTAEQAECLAIHYQN